MKTLDCLILRLLPAVLPVVLCTMHLMCTAGRFYELQGGQQVHGGCTEAHACHRKQDSS